MTIVSFEKPKCEQRKSTIQTLLEEHDIAWHPLNYTFRPPVRSTVYDIWKLRHKVKELHRKVPFQILHCRSYITALVGLHWKRKLGQSVRFVFDMRGFWPDERLEGGAWNLRNPVFRRVYKYFKRKDDTKLFDPSSVSEEATSWMRSQLGLSETTLTLVYIGVHWQLVPAGRNAVVL